MKLADIDVDYMLYSATPSTVTQEELAHVFSSKFEWHDESYLVQAIKKYLRTDRHKQTMNAFDFTIEDMLNGRIEGHNAQAAAERIFEDWNAKIGHKHFG